MRPPSECSEKEGSGIKSPSESQRSAVQGQTSPTEGHVSPVLSKKSSRDSPDRSAGTSSRALSMVGYAAAKRMRRFFRFLLKWWRAQLKNEVARHHFRLV